MPGKYTAPSPPNRHLDVLATYAEEFVDGRYAALREATKFEEFIGRIANYWDYDPRHLEHSVIVADLLRALFECAENQFNLNHAAIAFLLQNRIIDAILTTNFDNAIEQALAAIGTPFHAYIHPTYPRGLSTGNAALLKLHGDAPSGQYVATSPQLVNGQVLESHKYIRKLIEGKTVLVAGYSALGDIDIRPHLIDVRATFVWITWGRTELPDFATYWCRSNLTSEEANENWLVGLASHAGWPGTRSAAAAPPWRERLATWFSGIPLDALRDAALVMFEQGPGSMSGWPLLHLHHVYAWDVEKRSRTVPPPWTSWRDGIPFLAVSAYASAGEAFELAKPETVVTADSAQFKILQGLRLWRQGCLYEALEELKPLALGVLPKSFSNDLVFLGTRLYLEVARDLLRSERNLARRVRLSTSIQVDAALDRLPPAPHQEQSIESALLNRVVRLELQWFLKRSELSKNDWLADIRGVYDDAWAVQSWNAVEAAGRAWAARSAFSGFKALYRINRILMKQRHLKRVRKSLAAVLYGVTKLALFVDVIDGHIGARFGLPLREAKYRHKAFRWLKALKNAERKFIE